MNHHELAILGGQAVRERPWPVWPKSDLNTERAVLDVLRSGRWTLTGPNRGSRPYERKFAECFAQYVGVAHCTPTTSGTASIRLALQALGIGPGDEVIVPGLTWVACASAVFFVGAIPILVDIDEHSLAIAPGAVEKAITPHTKAILIVHPFCRLADLPAFLALSQSYNVPVIEDCSQSHGARFKGKRVGSFGLIGCFSMQQSKLLTSGEGGAVVTNSTSLSDRIEQLRADGRTFADKADLNRLELVERGQVQGQNLCLSELQSALLLAGLEQLDAQNELRVTNATELDEAIAGFDGVSTLAKQDHVYPAYYNVVLRFDPNAFEGITADAFARALSAEVGIQVSPLYRPLNAHPLYQPLNSPLCPTDPAARASLDPKRFDLPVAWRSRRIHITLPHCVLLDECCAETIAEAIEKLRRRAADLVSLEQGETNEAF